MVTFRIIIILLTLLFLSIGYASGAKSAPSPELGTREMTSNAGVRSVEVPKRRNIIEVSSPGDLTQQDSEYRLVRDIVADGTAFTVKASHITLNLNGYRIIYGSKDTERQSFGVFIEGTKRKDIDVINGKIVQGSGRCSGDEQGAGCNPIYSQDTSDLEVAGLHMIFKTPATSALFINSGKGVHVYQNTIEDSGAPVSSKGAGIAAVEGRTISMMKVYRNLFKKVRHTGIRTGLNSDIYNNEIYISSTVPNGSGIQASGGAIHHNKIFGEGVQSVGISPGSGMKVFSNYVEMQVLKKAEEHANEGGATCIRISHGTDAVEVMYNTFALTIEGNGSRSWGRAVVVGLSGQDQKALIYNNTIIATGKDSKARAVAVAIAGSNESTGVIFRNNRIVSSWGNIVLGNSGGHAGGYVRFIENTLVRQDPSPYYRTIRDQNAAKPGTIALINNKFENGASLESIELEAEGPARREIAVGWHIDIVVTDGSGKPVSDAGITLRDNAGMVVFEGTTGEKGAVQAEAMEYVMTTVPGQKGMQQGIASLPKLQKIMKTPHKILISKGTLKVERSVRVDGDKILILIFDK